MSVSSAWFLSMLFLLLYCGFYLHWLFTVFVIVSMAVLNWLGSVVASPILIPLSFPKYFPGITRVSRVSSSWASVVPVVCWHFSSMYAIGMCSW